MAVKIGLNGFGRIGRNSHSKDPLYFDTQKARYQLIEPLGEGVFGQACAAKIVRIHKTGNWLIDSKPRRTDKVVIKFANIQKEFSPSENQAFLKDVNDTINSDHSALQKLAGLSCVARIYDIGMIKVKLSNHLICETIFLVEEFLQGTRFDDYLLLKFGKSDNASHVFSGISDQQEFFDYALRLTYSLREIHHRGIIHGDIWQKNIMVMDDGSFEFIDFGASAFRDNLFLRADRLARRRNDAAVAPERRLGDRHGRRSDIYSMGYLFYFMCTGQHAPQDIPDIDELKDTIVAGIEKHNPKLLEENPGIADIIARCRRHNKDSRTRDADALLNELRLFSFADHKSRCATDPAQRCVKHLLCKSKEGKISIGPLFPNMLRMDAARLRSRAEDMKRGVLELSGDHEELVMGMSTYLSLLGEKDTLLARLTPRFWSERNMGVNGRFLSMVKLVAQRGANLKHLLLVCDGDRDDMDIRRMLEEHLRVANQLSKSGHGGFHFHCKPVTAEQRTRFIKERDWEHCLAISEDTVMAVRPVYDNKDILRTVRFVKVASDSKTTAERHKKEMEIELDTAPSLESWLRRTQTG